MCTCQFRLANHARHQIHANEPRPGLRHPIMPTAGATPYVKRVQSWREIQGSRGVVENTVSVTLAVALVRFDSDAELDGVRILVLYKRAIRSKFLHARYWRRNVSLSQASRQWRHTYRPIVATR
jgi:hypothetical protein